MNVEKVNNGYVVTQLNGQKDVAHTLEEAFDIILFIFEGKGKYFVGDSFGKVIILDKPAKEYPSVDPA